MPDEAVLIIFVKNLEAGNVKTRLAETVGQEQALAVYEKLLAYTQGITRPLAAAKQVWYSDFVAEGDGWSPRHYSKKVQRGSGLGDRMRHALAEVFREGCQKAVIIGSDCAELTGEVIRKAYAALDARDVVVGPSADGGYYLLGMNRFLPGLFDSIAWSTPRVLKQTVARIEQAGLGWHALPELNDVDTESDWNEVKDRLKFL